MITFGLPDERNREEIAAQYAKQLKKPELSEFARKTEGWVNRRPKLYLIFLLVV